jgi:uncharacterized membrane protein YjdF
MTASEASRSARSDTGEGVPERIEETPWWTKLFLGEWGPIVRDPLDVLRLAFVVGTIVWLVTGRDAADGLVASSLLLLAARAVSLPRFYDLLLIVAMTITGWGSALHFYGQWSWYDNVVHVLMPLLVTPIIYVLLVRLGVLPELRDLTQVHQQLGFFLIAFCFGMAISGGWEVLEWWLDVWTGTHRVKDAADTAGDLTSGLWGSIGAGLLLIAWSQLGLPLRRVSGERAAQLSAERRRARASAA